MKGVPDAIVGIIRISHCTDEMQLQEILARGEETLVPADFLREYLGPRRVGYCWTIASVVHFTECLPFYSKGQTVKGAPSQLRQTHVHEEIRNMDTLQNPEEAVLSSLYQQWKAHQRSIVDYRRQKKAELYAAIDTLKGRGR